MNKVWSKRMTLVLLSLPFGACATAVVPSPASDTRKSTILFICPHGGAKSLIAASYFNRLAKEHALSYTGVAAAAEDPYESVPEPVAALLEGEGFSVRSFKPRNTNDDDLRLASRIISIDCDLEKFDGQGRSIERWDDVPKVSEDLAGSVSAIRAHLDRLVVALKAHR